MAKLSDVLPTLGREDSLRRVRCRSERLENPNAAITEMGETTETREKWVKFGHRWRAGVPFEAGAKTPLQRGAARLWSVALRSRDLRATSGESRP